MAKIPEGEQAAAQVTSGETSVSTGTSLKSIFCANCIAQCNTNTNTKVPAKIHANTKILKIHVARQVFQPELHSLQ